MGIAIISGVIASLHPDTVAHNFPKWETHTPGTTTPTDFLDATVPSRLIACVSRPETATKLKATFGRLGRPVEVVASNNVEAILQSDVVMLWYVHSTNSLQSSCNKSQLQAPISTLDLERRRDQGSSVKQASDQHSGWSDHISNRGLGGSYDEGYSCHAQHSV